MTNENIPEPNGKSGVKHHRHHHKLKHRFKFEKTLGKGTYGKVKLATELETGKQVAIKTVPKSKIKDPQDLKRIHKEIEIMASMVHPHIIAIHEVFENKEKIVLVMEYASRGELYDYADQHDISTQEVQRIFRQIVSAVAFCHMNNVVHRDLKLENIFLDEQNNIKIGDFGLSSKYDDNEFLYTFCGSPLYASPEIVCGLPYHGPEVDCWSLGVILYALVYRTMPFKDDNFSRLKSNITAGRYEPVPFSSDAEPLIKHMLNVNAKKRATIEDIMRYDWVCGTGSLPSPSEMYLKVQTQAKMKVPAKSILKNSARSCNSGGSAVLSASSVYSDPLSEFDSSTVLDGSECSSAASATSGKKNKPLLQSILKKNADENAIKLDSASDSNTILEETSSGKELTAKTAISQKQQTLVSKDGVVLRTKVQSSTASEIKSRDSVRLSKRMSCGKYSRLTKQWEQLCRGERQFLEVEKEEEEERVCISNRDVEAIAKSDEFDNASSGDDSVVLEILSTPVLKKAFSFDFEGKASKNAGIARRQRKVHTSGV